MKGLLATQGLHVRVQSDFATRLPTLRRWDGQPLPPAIVQRLEREWAKVELLTTHLKGLETERHQAIQAATDPMAAQVRQLVALRGIGEHSAWVFVAEHFAWRQLRNRRQVGALAGLVPLPHKTHARLRPQSSGAQPGGADRVDVGAVSAAECADAVVGG